MKLPWPELPSAHRPDESLREILDYLIWIVGIMNQAAYPSAAERMAWSMRVQQAYSALFLPPIPNHGDPYPPDVPPPVNPGVWPDIPSSSVPGMTVRHQLKVIGMLARSLRDEVWAHAKPEDITEWDGRITRARERLDHGQGVSMPEESRTTPSDAILAEARAQEEAFRDHARKRAQRIQRLKAQAKKAAKQRADNKAKAEVEAQEAAAEAKRVAAEEKKAAAAAKRAEAAARRAEARQAKAAAKAKAAPKKAKAARKKAKAAPKAKAKAAPKAKAKAAPKRKAKAAPKAKAKAAPKRKAKAAPKAKAKAAPKRKAKAAPKAKAKAKKKKS